MYKNELIISIKVNFLIIKYTDSIKRTHSSNIIYLWNKKYI